MKCPHCPNTEVRLRDKACAQCGTPTTLNALVFQASRQVRLQSRRLTTVRCPECGQGLSMRLRACPFCSADLTVGTVLTNVLQPVGRRGRHLLQHPPSPAKRVAQWLYLLGSLKLLGALLLGLGRLDGLRLLYLALLSVPYLALGLLVLVWVGPRPWQRRLVQQSSGLVKVALLLNLLSLLLLSQGLFENHWKLSLILGGVILVSWAGAWVFTEGLWPMMLKLGEIFRRPGAGSFDPSQPQGRKGRFQ